MASHVHSSENECCTHKMVQWFIKRGFLWKNIEFIAHQFIQKVIPHQNPLKLNWITTTLTQIYHGVGRKGSSARFNMNISLGRAEERESPESCLLAFWGYSRATSVHFSSPDVHVDSPFILEGLQGPIRKVLGRLMYPSCAPEGPQIPCLNLIKELR